jgi:hypothetical protein
MFDTNLVDGMYAQGLLLERSLQRTILCRCQCHTMRMMTNAASATYNPVLNARHAIAVFFASTFRCKQALPRAQAR